MPSTRGRVIALIVFTISFSVLMILIWNAQIQDLDGALRNWAINFNTPDIVMVWKVISFLGSGAFLTGLTLLLLAIFTMRGDWWAGRKLTIAMGGSIVLDNLLKWTVARPRPAEIYAQTMPTSYSFPSGHALFSIVFYLSVACIIGRGNKFRWNKSLVVATFLLVAAIGASRIFLGVHYGTDVLGGYLVGAAWLTLLSIWRSSEL